MTDLTKEDIEFLDKKRDEIAAHFDVRGLVVVVAVETWQSIAVKTAIARVVGDGPPTKEDLQWSIAGAVMGFLSRFGHMKVGGRKEEPS